MMRCDSMQCNVIRWNRIGWDRSQAMDVIGSEGDLKAGRHCGDV